MPDVRELLDGRRRVIATWLIVLSPLAFWPGAFSRFTIAKLLVVAIGCAFAALASPRGRLPRTWWLIVLAGFVVLAAAAVSSDAPVASAFGRWPRYEGLPTIALYVGAAAAGARVIGHGADQAVWQRPVEVLALALGLLTALDLLGVSPLGESALTRDGSVLGNATDQGVVAMICLAVLVPPLLARRSATLVTAVVAATFALAVSGSRAAIAVTVVVLVAEVSIISRAATRERTRGVTLRWGAGVAVSIGLLVLALPVTRDRLFTGTTVHGRFLQYPPTADLLVDHPLLGVGPSGYVDEFGRYETAELVAWGGPYRIFDAPHALPLQALSAGGPLLLILALALAAWCVRRGWVAVHGDPALLGPAMATAACGVALLPHFTSAGTVCIAAFFAGVVLAEPSRRSDDRRDLGGAIGGAAACAMAVALGAAGVGDVWVAHGVASAQRGDTAAAADDFAAASRWRPWDADVHLFAAQSLAGAASGGDRAAAGVTSGHARAALSRTPTSYQAHVTLGVALAAVGRAGEAVDELGAAIELSPQRPDGYVQRALVNVELGNIDWALGDLGRARHIAPSDPVIEQVRRRARALRREQQGTQRAR